MKLKLKEDTDDHKTRIVEYQKKQAIDKATEVIRTFEELAKTDPKIDMRKLRRTVLANLVANNKDKEPSEAWWSY